MTYKVGDRIIIGCYFKKGMIMKTPTEDNTPYNVYNIILDDPFFLNGERFWLEGEWNLSLDKQHYRDCKLSQLGI